jgi:beta-lactam-binding protein with PASTA domain
VMPDLVEENLQLAQDRLEALGSYILNQEDALGLGRIQVVDSNWKVCSQRPAQGTRISVNDEVTLFAAKLDEDCP